MVSRFVSFTPFPDPEDGPVLLNPHAVTAVVPSAPDPDTPPHTVIFTSDGKAWRVDEDLAKVLESFAHVREYA
jgi:hypothetical protein